MKWYLEALRKYAVFAGRARRREYWIFELWNSLIAFALFIVAFTVLTFEPGHSELAYLPTLYVLGVALPSLSSLVRRLHDTNHRGRWIFISLVPVVGGLILLAFTIKDSDPGDNRYGPNPKMQEIEPHAATPEMGYLAPPLDSDRR